jgi:hypothetical protein
MIIASTSRGDPNMTNSEREEILKQLADSRERLLAMTQGLTSEQLAYRAAPDRWSVGECIEHLTIVEGRVLGRIQDAITQGPDHSKRSAKEGEDRDLADDVAGRVTRFKAPEFLEPKGQLTREELLANFEANRKRTREFAESTHADLRRHFAPHPVFGELDCYQWLLLTASHCDRHRVQSEEVMASPGFPRAGKASA